VAAVTTERMPERVTEPRQWRWYLPVVAIRPAFLPAFPVAPLGCLLRRVSGAVCVCRHLHAWRAVAASPPDGVWHLSGAWWQYVVLQSSAVWQLSGASPASAFSGSSVWSPHVSYASPYLASCPDEIAPELTGHGLPLIKCEAYNRVYDQSYRLR
jgi:hypothetical protein